MLLSLERQIPAILILAVLLMAGIGYFAYYNVTRTKRAVEWEKHTQQVIQKLDKVLLSTLDIETSARGFFVTGQEEFLEPYKLAKPQIEPTLAELKNLVKDNPDQFADSEILTGQVAEKIKQAESVIEMRRTKSTEEILSLLGTTRGKQLMDDVRLTVSKLKDAEVYLLKLRQEELNTSLNRSLTILLAGITLGILMLGLANYAVLREVGKRREAEKNLRGANLDLENRVTERTKQLSESEIFSRAILDSLSAHIAVLDKKGNIIAVNEAWKNFAGQNAGAPRSETTHIGQNYLYVCVDDGGGVVETTDSVKIMLKAVLDGESDGFMLEYPCHSPTEERWFLMQVSGLQSADGGAVVSHINITDRKKAEMELKDSEEFNRSIVDNSPDCVKVLELDGSLISMNRPGMCLMEIEDFTPFLRKQWADNWKDEFYAEAKMSVEKARAGETYYFQGPCKTAKGTLKWWDVTVSPVFNAEGKIARLIVTSRDVTERKKAEIEREQLLAKEQEARREAEIANRLRDEFMALVSHELRTPLNSILGWAKILKKGGLNAEMQEKAINTIIRNSELQNRLIEDLLDVGRIVSGKLILEKVEIGAGDFVKQTFETVKPSADAKSINLTLNADGASGKKILGDPNRLQQVVWNLLNNAIKFTPSGGNVEIDLSDKNGFVEIKVTDSGVGINHEFLPFVFERFRQDAATFKQSGGLGLGLAIVRQLTEMHGGSVAVHSEGENKGATFTLKFPISE